ncbi:hypothetical protein MPTK1_5g07420 [Marchantia polymorpha subsp. ruderalis]|uniref:Uncharacterized protein n=2 Tax=Marchantia polymorpha TaxID=3197 RepID=A0AAF6BFX0_MARPO|nr:hypothetical protein MARPO_0127s0044 [Marchantia polymorpha]BBN10904.1 hypothetical protein Mp_5g07420 [Marchantia polymorpha subsp. ruderalis]|eukprot:PTQ30262.1 hypothetical protein MARPO_0127s0044 [Marchantia polymorpha]
MRTNLGRIAPADEMRRGLESAVVRYAASRCSALPGEAAAGAGAWPGAGARGGSKIGHTESLAGTVNKGCADSGRVDDAAAGAGRASIHALKTRSCTGGEDCHPRPELPQLCRSGANARLQTTNGRQVR